MTTAALILAAILAIVAVLFVARPFLARARGGREEVAAPDSSELEHLRLLEERDRALAALKELEFDHRTGKIADEDYLRLVRSLRAEAAEALSTLAEAEGDRRPPLAEPVRPPRPER